MLAHPIQNVSLRIHAARYAIELGRQAYQAGRTFMQNAYDSVAEHGNYLDWQEGWIAGYDAEADGVH